MNDATTSGVQNGEIPNELGYSLSVDAFRGKSVDSFRAEVRQSLLTLRSNACNGLRSDSPVISYDHERLVKGFQVVQWTEIFDHHDKSTGQHSNTALTIFVALIADPFVWPSCCQFSAASSLVNAVLKHGAQLSVRERMQSRAHRFTRKFVLRILLRTIPPWAHNVSLLLPEFHNRSQPTVSHICVQLSLVREWMSALSQKHYKYFVKSLCNVLCTLDCMEVASAFIQKKKGPESHELLKLKGKDLKDFRGSAVVVDHLHGDIDEEESEALISMFAKRIREQHACTTQTARKLILSSIALTDIQHDEQAPRHAMRSKCIDLLLKIRQRGHLASFIGQLLKEASSCTHSSSICWLILLAVDQVDDSDKMTFHDLTLAVWRRRQDNPFFVGFFFAILSICSYFDDSELLWAALRPLHALVYDAMTKDKSTVHATITIEYRYHFALFLTRRGNMLNTNPQFTGLAAQLSILFGEARCWIPQGCQQDQTELIMGALQLARILSGSSLHLEEEQSEDSLSIDSFDAFLLRSAGCWCGNTHHRQPHLLSTMSLSNGPHQLDDARDTTPINMNSDVFSHIFAFLGYKRVCQVRQVSKEWRQMADHDRLWHKLYKGKFPLLPQDIEAQNESRPWKQLFEDRVFAIGELRARQCRKSAPLALCRFVGCCAIVQRKSLDKHHATHSKKKATRKKTTTKRRTPAKRSKSPAPQRSTSTQNRKRPSNDEAKEAPKRVKSS